MMIGVYAIGWLVWAFLLSHRIGSCVPPAAGAQEQFCYLLPPAKVAFQVIADALAAATVVQLAYTLFTPGPDEALDPVLLAIATTMLYQLGTVTSFHWQDGLAVLLYGATLAGLFVIRVFIAPDEEKPPRLWWWKHQHPSQLPSSPPLHQPSPPVFSDVKNLETSTMPQPPVTQRNEQSNSLRASKSECGDRQARPRQPQLAVDLGLVRRVRVLIACMVKPVALTRLMSSPLVMRRRFSGLVSRASAAARLAWAFHPARVERRVGACFAVARC